MVPLSLFCDAIENPFMVSAATSQTVSYEQTKEESRLPLSEAQAVTMMSDGRKARCRNRFLLFMGMIVRRLLLGEASANLLEVGRH